MFSLRNKHTGLIAVIACMFLFTGCSKAIIGRESYVKLGLKTEDFDVRYSDKSGKILIGYTGLDDEAVVILEKITEDITRYKNTYIVDKGTDEIASFTYGAGEYIIKLGLLDKYDTSKVKILEEYRLKVELNDTKPFTGKGYYTKYGKEIEGLVVSTDTESRLEFVERVYKYVKNSINYNYDLANLITSGKIIIYKPKLEDILSTQKGICLDYASLMASILKYNDIPVKVCIGYNESGDYHAWVDVYINGEWKVFDPTLGRTYRDDVFKYYQLDRYY